MRSSLPVPVSATWECIWPGARGRDCDGAGEGLELPPGEGLFRLLIVLVAMIEDVERCLVEMFDVVDL